MHLKTPNTSFISIVTAFFLIASFCLYLNHEQTWPRSSISTFTDPLGLGLHLKSAESPLPIHQQQEEDDAEEKSPPPLPALLLQPRHAPTDNLRLITDPNPDAILLPDWEVLVVSPLGAPIPINSSSSDQLVCLFQNNHISPTGTITTFNRRTTFKCILPPPVRHSWPPLRPILTNSPTTLSFPKNSPTLFLWNFLTYESLSTETDVILFAKGVNNRQGINRRPQSLRCVFSSSDVGVVSTAVLTSNQEVFRCRHPRDIPDHNIVRVSLEMKPENRTLPSVAYYTPPTRNVAKTKSLICACTMVYNVAKLLKEWVLYNANIGVEKFFLYDNGSDDDLDNVVNDLIKNGYSVEIVFWPWSKTQEAGFSHCATYANDTCAWMMFVDVDEFVYSPTWLRTPYPSSHMLKSLLPKPTKHHRAKQIGQVMMMCHDFGPSNQRSHPVEGVTQGYTCRSRVEQRHKSIVLLDAIETSLVNVVHHFGLKKGFRWKKLGLGEGIVNHYKYQAWSEFKNKFKRRVSAYVVDWREGVNPKSKDRTPGLGFEPIEPKGWANKFCSVRDYRLKELTRKWFGLRSKSENKMAWQEM